MTRIIAVLSGLLACAALVAGAEEGTMTGKFAITSPTCPHGQPISPRFTADGSDLSPEIHIENPPDGAESFALIVDDPDAPAGTWVHWVVWNLPATTDVIAEGSLPEAAVEGRNSWGRNEYNGPAPPSGTHRYFFKAYALDTTLDLPRGTDKAGLERAMQGHVLADAVFMGTYRR